MQQNNYYDLGNHTRPITTASVQSQLWFDRGLMWTYAFNHEEAVRCFQKAIQIDPLCAMAWWGIAYASGPFYNKPWKFFGADELSQALIICYGASQKAISLSSNATQVEQALIQALAHRYQSAQPPGIEDIEGWNNAYAHQMKLVHVAFPEDLDIIAFYAESLITQTPWELWDTDNGVPAKNAETVEAMAVLERGIQLIEEQTLKPHPGILHIYIHTMEMSPYPERALRAADMLRDSAPEDAGHLLHMPSHIDVLCGHYHNAIVANNKAIQADTKYLDQVGLLDFYTLARCHNYHLKMYAAMLSGQYKTALEATNGIVDTVSDEMLTVANPLHFVSSLEGYFSMKAHVLVRFGKWQEIIDEAWDLDEKLYCVTKVMFHYARCVAHSAMGNIAAAEKEKTLFDIMYEQVPHNRRFFNNSARDVLAIASEMLQGELAYRKESYDEAFAHLRKAIHLDDHLAYTEPWAWMHPPRHALGALLLEQNRIMEAEAIYRADLGLDNTLKRPAQHPNNVWSLHGYVECLQRQERHDEANAMTLQLNLALARADIEINASCCCRLNHHCCD